MSKSPQLTCRGLFFVQNIGIQQGRQVFQSCICRVYGLWPVVVNASYIKSSSLMLIKIHTDAALIGRISSVACQTKLIKSDGRHVLFGAVV